MKERQLEVKDILRLGLLVVAAAAIVLLVRIAVLQLNRPSYKAYVQIAAVLEDDSTYESKLDIFVDGSIGKIKTDFYKGSIYAEDNKIVFDVGNKYKYYEDNITFRDLKKFIDKIKLEDVVFEGDGEKGYNPELGIDVINDVLKMLFIDRETTKTASAQITRKENKLNSFSLYLTDIEGYKDINITISFDGFKSSDKFDVPTLYGDIMERVDFEEIAMIK